MISSVESWESNGFWCVGVNVFGFGGINVYVVLESYGIDILDEVVFLDFGIFF